VIDNGSAETELLKYGDRIKIDHQDYDGNSIFGVIDQIVKPLED